jgi:prepilin-type N-terminal cleavage/methylation domain-containing protein
MRTDSTAPDAGFSLIELLVVIAILGTVGAMAAMVSPLYAKHARAEAGVAEALDVFRAAREVAVSERRNVQVEFVGTDALRMLRVEIPGGGTTVLRTVQLENRMEFRKQPGVPDTPDGFGSASAVAFGTSPTRMFTSEGTFVDANGDVLNGTLFLSIAGEKNSARAITVFGTTGLLRVWRWDGQKWTE